MSDQSSPGWIFVRVHDKVNFNQGYVTKYHVTRAMLEMGGKVIRVKYVRAPSWAPPGGFWYMDDQLKAYWHWESLLFGENYLESSSLVTDDKDILEEDY